MSAPALPALFATHWHLDAMLLAQTALCASVYLWAAHTTRGRWQRARTASFLAGLGCVLVALMSGIDAYADRMLSVHMAQHMLLLLLAPLLLLGGRPLELALRVLPGPERRSLARGARRLARHTGPVPCLAVFALVVLLTHLPAFYDATLRHPTLHVAEHLAYLVAGLLVWWPIVGGDPVPAHRLGGLGRLVYVLAMMPPMALLGAYLNRTATLVYPAYGPPAHGLGISALVDQQQAGAIMWVAGSTVVVAAGLWAVISAMLAEERRQQARDAYAPGALGVPLGGSHSRLRDGGDR